MSSNIQIKFLTLEEMANASDIDYRYEHVGIDNLGFADKKKNRVYVRAGLEQQLQNILIDHELNHLFELEGTDEDEHGIRHKKKGGFMKIFLPIVLAIVGSILVPGIGGLIGLGGMGGLMGGAAATGLGSMLGGVAGSSMTGKPNWGGNAIGGAAAGIGSGIGSALGGLGGSAGGSGIGGTAGKASGSFMGDVGSGVGSIINAGGGTISSGPGIAGQMAGQATGSGIGQSIGQLAGGTMGSLFSGALGQGQSAQGGYGPTSGGQNFRQPDLNQQANNNPSFSGWGDYGALPEMGGNYGMASGVDTTGAEDQSGVSKMPINPGLMQGGIGLAGRTGFNDMFGEQDMGMSQPQQGFGGAMSF